MNKNFVLKSAASLSKEEMKNVKGGISLEEYCATMDMLWENNADDWSVDTLEGFWHGYSTNCK